MGPKASYDRILENDSTDTFKTSYFLLNIADIKPVLKPRSGISPYEYIYVDKSANLVLPSETVQAAAIYFLWKSPDEHLILVKGNELAFK